MASDRQKTSDEWTAMVKERAASKVRTLSIEISEADAKQLLALLETTSTFPDVVDELRERLNVRQVINRHVKKGK